MKNDISKKTPQKPKGGWWWIEKDHVHQKRPVLRSTLHEREAPSDGGCQLERPWGKKWLEHTRHCCGGDRAQKQCVPPSRRPEGERGWMCSKAQAPPERPGRGSLPSLLSDEQSRNRFLSQAGGWTSERSGTLSALDTAVKSSKGGLCALSGWIF